MKFTTINPATEEVIAEYSTMAQEKVNHIIQESHQAFLHWKDSSLSQRSTYFVQLAKVLRKNKDKYAILMATEMGKPVKEGRAEVEKCAWTAEVYAQHSAHWLHEEIVSADGKKHAVIFEPLGIILGIMPWNFPFWQVLRFAIPTMMAGNTILLKHARAVTGSALEIEQLFLEAGFPKHLFKTIIIEHNAIDYILSSPSVAGVSLTGSTNAGKKIAETAGRHLKKVLLELGGSDPLIVLEDADIDLAAKGAVQGRMQNCGQSCIAAKRFIVSEKISAAFLEKFNDYLSHKKLGDPLQEDTDIGPLIDSAAVLEMEKVVEDAIKNGAKLCYGGKRLPKGFFFQPTILTNVQESMKVFSEEVFGPIAPVIIFKNEKEAVRLANNTEFGLGGSIWSKDLDKAEKIARELECGAVFINSIVKSDPRMPFGGIKQSGLGRELSHYGLKEFVNIKAINVY